MADNKSKCFCENILIKCFKVYEFYPAPGSSFKYQPIFVVESKSKGEPVFIFKDDKLIKINKSVKGDIKKELGNIPYPPNENWKLLSNDDVPYTIVSSVFLALVGTITVDEETLTVSEESNSAEK